MQDGFVDGFDHAIQYIKENIKVILTASCEPAKAKIVVVMGLDPIVKFIEASYREEEAKVASQRQQQTQAQRPAETTQTKQPEPTKT